MRCGARITDCLRYTGDYDGATSSRNAAATQLLPVLFSPQIVHDRNHAVDEVNNFILAHIVHLVSLEIFGAAQRGAYVRMAILCWEKNDKEILCAHLCRLCQTYMQHLFVFATLQAEKFVETEVMIELMHQLLHEIAILLPGEIGADAFDVSIVLTSTLCVNGINAMPQKAKDANSRYLALMAATDRCYVLHTVHSSNSKRHACNAGWQSFVAYCLNEWKHLQVPWNDLLTNDQAWLCSPPQICLCAYYRTMVLSIAENLHHSLLHHLHLMLSDNRCERPNRLVPALRMEDVMHSTRSALLMLLDASTQSMSLLPTRVNCADNYPVDIGTCALLCDENQIGSFKASILDSVYVYMLERYILVDVPMLMYNDIEWLPQVTLMHRAHAIFGDFVTRKTMSLGTVSTGVRYEKSVVESQKYDVLEEAIKHEDACVFEISSSQQTLLFDLRKSDTLHRHPNIVGLLARCYTPKVANCWLQFLQEQLDVEKINTFQFNINRHRQRWNWPEKEVAMDGYPITGTVYVGDAVDTTDVRPTDTK